MQVAERLDHLPAHAGVAAGERRDLQRDDETHGDIVEQRSRARRMRQHERPLQLGKARVVDPRARQQAEPGIDAVDGLVSGDDARHRRRGRIDLRARRRSTCNVCEPHHSARNPSVVSAPGRSSRRGITIIRGR
jgi:hypothetical protein